MQPATRVSLFRESVIRDMSRLAAEHGAINLSQGFPDFDPPVEVTEAARQAIADGENQYGMTWGRPLLRELLAERYRAQLGWQVDPLEHVTVVCGVTEGIVASMLTVLNPGDEIIILDPAHDNFRPSAHIASAVPVSVPLEPPDYRLDPERLAAAVTPRTRAMLVNTPHNPTGRVLDALELDAITRTVVENDLVLITDEIYDRIVYDGNTHVSPGSLEPLRDRTITLSGFGKTFAVTGWRLGWVIAPPALAQGMHTVHDFLTICAPTPLQVAAEAALHLPDSYFESMLADYDTRRSRMMEILELAGFESTKPDAAYYVLSNYKDLPIPQASLDATAFARWMTTDVGVAVVPGDACYNVPGLGDDMIRFAFCKRLETLDAAAERMAVAFG